MNVHTSPTGGGGGGSGPTGGAGQSNSSVGRSVADQKQRRDDATRKRNAEQAGLAGHPRDVSKMDIQERQNAAHHEGWLNPIGKDGDWQKHCAAATLKACDACLAQLSSMPNLETFRKAKAAWLQDHAFKVITRHIAVAARYGMQCLPEARAADQRYWDFRKALDEWENKEISKVEEAKEAERAAREAAARAAAAAANPPPPPVIAPPKAPSPSPVEANAPPVPETATEDAQALSDQPSHPELETAKQSLPPEALQDPCINASCEAADLGMAVADQLRAEGNAEGATQLSDAVVSSIRDIGEAWGNTTTGSVVSDSAKAMYTMLTFTNPDTNEPATGGEWTWAALQWAPIGKIFGGFAKFAGLLGVLSDGAGPAAKAAKSALEGLKKASEEAAQVVPQSSKKAVGEALDAAIEHGKQVVQKLSEGWTGVGEAAEPFDHIKLFEKYFPEITRKKTLTIHHAVEKWLLDKFPGVFTRAELESIENLRGIPNALNANVHLSDMRIAWNRFYERFEHAAPTRQQVLDFAKELDDLYGHLFNPPIRKAPKP